jgi:hypothetical protein
MNSEQIVEQRVKFGLEPPCPLQVRRERVVAAMSDLFWRGYSEDDVRAVVSTSDTGWRRAQAWYRQVRCLAPDAPLTPAPRGSEVARAEVVSRGLAGSRLLHQSPGGNVRVILNSDRHPPRPEFFEGDPGE